MRKNSSNICIYFYAKLRRLTIIYDGMNYFHPHIYELLTQKITFVMDGWLAGVVQLVTYIYNMRAIRDYTG